MFPKMICAFCFLLIGVPGQQAAQKVPKRQQSEGEQAMARLRTLAGNWTSTAKEPHAVGDVVVSYKLIGRGSTVVETLFPGRSTK